MKKYTYSSDCGAIQLGNENFVCHYLNGYGDGTFPVYITKKDEKPTDNFSFKGTVQGTFNVYCYDCDTEEVLTTLTGRYAVFAKSGTIILEKWED